MKGNPQVIERLNFLLADELTAINQYIVHSKRGADWGYSELHEDVEKRAIQEMKHAETLIARILFLEGLPSVSMLNKINIGKDVKGQLENYVQSEDGAQKAYNAGIRLAVEMSENKKREIV